MGVCAPACRLLSCFLLFAWLLPLPLPSDPRESASGPYHAGDAAAGGAAVARGPLQVPSWQL